MNARKVDFKAPERGPFEGPGRFMLRQAPKKATVALSDRAERGSADILGISG